MKFVAIGTHTKHMNSFVFSSPPSTCINMLPGCLFTGDIVLCCWNGSKTILFYLSVSKITIDVLRVSRLWTVNKNFESREMY